MSGQREIFFPHFALPIDVQQGKAGLWYVGSPLIPGLLVTGKSEGEAIQKVGRAVREMVDAIRAERAKS